MRLFKFITDWSVLFLCFWTLAYHVFLALGLPSGWIMHFFPIMLLLVLLSAFRQRRKLYRSLVLDPRPIGLVLAASAVVATRSLFFGHPNPDDLVYYHSVLVQLDNLKEPFFMQDLSHDIAMPFLSVLHLLSSYEKLCGFMSHWLSIDPVWGYQVGSAFVASFLLPMVFYLIYRQLRIRPLPAAFCTCTAVLFLALDGAPNGSFGNIAFNAIWIGKCALWALGIPTLYFMCMAYLRRPGAYQLFMLFATGVALLGLSNSGIFLVPMALLPVGIAYLFSSSLSARRTSRAVLLVAGAAYPLFIYGLVVTGVLKMPPDMSTWISGWPADWLDNIYYRVVDGGAALVKYLLILFILPAVSLSGASRRFMLMVSASIIVLYLNPVSGPLWMSAVTPASYWRVAYIFPLQIVAGLFALAIYKTLKAETASEKIVSATSIAVILISLALSYSHSALNPTFKLYMKKPSQPRLFGDEAAFAREAGGLVSGRTVLAPPEVVLPLGLMDSRARFYITRPLHTINLFSNAGLKEKALQRRDAQYYIQGNAAMEGAFENALDDGISAVVVPSTGRYLCSSVKQILLIRNEGWEEALDTKGYALFLRPANPIRPVLH